MPKDKKPREKPTNQAQFPNENGLVQRMANFNAVVDGDLERFRSVKDAVLDFRKLLQRFASLSLIKDSIASLQDDKGTMSPSKDRKVIASQLFAQLMGGKAEKANGDVKSPDGNDEMREWFLFEGKRFGSQVWDEAKQRVKAKWHAMDPKINASRNFLAAQAAKGSLSFANEGIPIMHASGRNYATFAVENKGEENERLIATLNWEDGKRQSLGPVRFIVKGHFEVNGEIRHQSQDWASEALFRAMAEGTIDFQTCVINLKDNTFRLSVPYRKPAKKTTGSQPDRSLDLAFAPNDGSERFLKLSIGSKDSSLDSKRTEEISLRQQVQRLVGFSKHMDKVSIDAAESKIGPRRSSHAKGVRYAIQNRQNRLTENQDNFKKNANHHLAKTIVGRAMSQGCGIIRVCNLPVGSTSGKNPVEAKLSDGLLGHPWPWAHFEEVLKYKAAEKEILVVSVKTPVINA